MGFDKDALIESLRNQLQNVVPIYVLKGTIAYYLLHDNRFRNSNSYLGAEFPKPVVIKSIFDTS
ncbi:Kinase associated domain 1 (KA1) [Artemisia annua]|uniref:Kinase associated domain 1 (KA1) n=1 Tax=Artemisia annua TaxID=35608 RepID=A0A2U1NIU3_ARTAN|nr:Kinase associated domain 1 (KA1) [Artemisia annua]